MASLFFSYSHKDEELRNELETHLVLLRRQGVISSWHDRRITAGSDIHAEISRELEGSQIVLLLVSASFLASDYCFDQEMSRALKKHEEGSAIIIPVILHPCDWHSAPFGHLRATPTDGKPISMWPNQHEALSIVARDIREAAQNFENNSKEYLSEDGSEIRAEQSSNPRSSNMRVKRKFDDHERDEFLENSYEYIARFFAGSLEELADRHSQIKTRFKRTSETGFTAAIYDNGQRVTECSIWNGGLNGLGTNGIAYSASGEGERNSFNELLSISDDGYAMQLRSMGMSMVGNRDREALSQEGAAELFWEMLLIRPLQQ